MATYETMIISSLADEALAPVLDKVKSIIGGHGGTIHSVDNLGQRTMEYMIKKTDKGTYVRMVFSGDRRSTVETEKYLRLTEGILRVMTVRLKDAPPPAADAPAAPAPAPAETGHE